jgi:glycosyltransferase involved in cell wall biosynthesis
MKDGQSTLTLYIHPSSFILPGDHPAMGRPLRILYAAGPGNVLSTYRHWKEGRDDPSQVSMTYSGQFYDVCRELGARAYVIASCRTPGFLRDGPLTIRHRPIAFEDGPALLYHLGQVWSGFRLLASALAFRADVAVVFNGTAHWFALGLLPLFGIRVVPSLHCVLWPLGRPPTGVRRLVQQLDARFFARRADAILSASGDITRQVVEMTRGRCRPVVEFLPTYRPGSFDFPSPQPLSPEGRGESRAPLPSGERGWGEGTGRPFRVFFAGRIERNKGVFDLLAIAQRFAAAGRTDIIFDLCGSGSALDELRQAAAAAGLTDHFHCHGYCSRAFMREAFARAHAVIVPTTSDFIEGFNQVVAEGVLSGRPVITSRVCPALDYVRDAVVEVGVDDVQGYGDAILRLCDDPEFYQARCRGCAGAQAQFYDIERSWGAALKKVLMQPCAAGAIALIPEQKAEGRRQMADGRSRDADERG